MLTEFIADAPLVEIGWFGLVLVLARMLFTGRLVTRREVDAKDEELRFMRKENSQWREAFCDLRDVVETSNDLIQAVVDVRHVRHLRSDDAEEGPV